LLSAGTASPLTLPLSLHDALPIYVVSGQLLEPGLVQPAGGMSVTINPFRYHHNGVWQTWEGGSLDLTPYRPTTAGTWAWVLVGRSEEHTSELQSRENLVCRLLLEK